MNRTSLIAVSMMTLAALAGGCGAADSAAVADKAGTDTVLLRLATIDGDVNGNGQLYGLEAFVDGLAQVSDGRLQVDVTLTYGDRAADAESKLVEAIASGEIDGGWPSFRAFANAGIDGLTAIEAPMTITNYDAAKALATGPASELALASLEGTGVVGLGLVVGPLRRPFAAGAPLLDPDDWAGERFRSYNSPVQHKTIQALGAEPVDLGIDWIDEIPSGRLRGIEFDIAQYHANGLTTEVGYATANVVLWPKVFVLAMSEQRWDSLTDEQQGWVGQAAAMAVEASVDATYDETTLAQELCDRGVRFVSASDEQLDALRSRVAPIIGDLAADPASSALLTEVQAVAREHPLPEIPDVPSECREVADSDDGSADDAFGVVPDETSDLPDGVYRVEITLDDVEGAGITNNDGWTGIWTLEISEGQYFLYCQPIDQPGRDCGNSSPQDEPYNAGHVRGSGSSVWFVFDQEVLGADYSLPSARFTWSLEDDMLRLTDPVTTESGFVPYESVLEPWHKIA